MFSGGRGEDVSVVVEEGERAGAVLARLQQGGAGRGALLAGSHLLTGEQEVEQGAGQQLFHFTASPEPPHCRLEVGI